MERSKIRYGDEIIQFHICYIPEKRNKISIHVYPDGAVQVDSPEDAPISDIKKAVTKRARWIYKHVQKVRLQTEFALQRHYVNGESHFYMGRRYKLKLIKVTRMEPSVRLFRGCIEVRTRDKSTSVIKKQLLEWYRDHANDVFPKRMEALVDKVSWLKEIPQWKLLSMTKQWGSCSPKGVISLNPHLVKAPRECIDYVLLHEMCHLKEHNHSQRYYRLLSQAMPGWELIKAKLDGMSELLLND